MITRLITSGLLIAFGIIILRYAIAKKRYFKPIVKYIVIAYSIIAITLGVLTLLCQTYEGYGTICLGIACCMFAYQDMKEHPVSKWTTAYLSQLGGYFAGIGIILYGIGLLK